MNGRSILFAAAKITLLMSLVWMVGFTLVLWLGWFDNATLGLAVNIFELACGLAAGVVVLLGIKFARNRHVMLGTALALLSWALGQVYWFSYSSITGETLPYPSVGDLGFTGTYVLLIGVIGIITHGQANAGRKWPHFIAFLILLAPVALSVTGKIKTAALIYNFILGLAVAYTIFRVCALLRRRNYRWFVAGVFLLGLTDLLFMTVVSVFPERYAFASDSLYPISLALISFGIINGDEAENA